MIPSVFVLLLTHLPKMDEGMGMDDLPGLFSGLLSELPQILLKNGEILKIASETLTWLRELPPATTMFRHQIDCNRIHILKICKRIASHLKTFYGQNISLGTRIYELLPGSDATMVRINVYPHPLLANKTYQEDLLPSFDNYSHIQGVLTDLLAMHATREKFEMAYREQWRAVKRMELLLLDSELEKILLVGSQRGLLVGYVEKEGFMGIIFEGSRDALYTFRE